jgi:hypothetical protein
MGRGFAIASAAVHPSRRQRQPTRIYLGMWSNQRHYAATYISLH